MPGLWFLPAPVSFAQLRDPVCSLPRTVPVPVPVLVPVPARREAATGCQAGAGAAFPPNRAAGPAAVARGTGDPGGPGEHASENCKRGAGFAATDTPEHASLQGKDGFSSFSHVGREIRFPGAV